MRVKLSPMAGCIKFSGGRTHPSLASVSLTRKWAQRIVYGSLSHSRFRLLKAGIVGLHRQKEDPREPKDPSSPSLPSSCILHLRNDGHESTNPKRTMAIFWYFGNSQEKEVTYNQCLLNGQIKSQTHKDVGPQWQLWPCLKGFILSFLSLIT